MRKEKNNNCWHELQVSPIWVLIHQFLLVDQIAAIMETETLVVIPSHLVRVEVYSISDKVDSIQTDKVV